MRLLYFALFLFALPVVFARTPKIIKPENGKKIKPGAEFDFQYQTVLDSGYISTNYTVMLFTKEPKSAHPTEFWASGYIFGRYSIPNMGNTNPTNRAPSKLRMPDFVDLWAGAGRGQSAHDAIFWLSVIEEFQTSNGSLGYNFALSTNYSRYPYG